MTEKDYFKIAQIGFIGWWMVKFDCDGRRKIERRVKWHKWFAWRPVRIEYGDCRWLEYVERRYCFSHKFEDEWHCEYRAIKD